jgi:hypothetical protein
VCVPTEPRRISLPVHQPQVAIFSGGYTNSGGTMPAFVSSDQGIDGGGGGGGAAAHHEGSSSSACDIDRPPKVIMLLSDIESIRIDKLRSELQGLSHNELSAAFTTDDEGHMVPNPEKSAENLIMDSSRIGHLGVFQLAPFLKETFGVHGGPSGAPKTNAHHVLKKDDLDADVAQKEADNAGRFGKRRNKSTQMYYYIRIDFSCVFPIS